MRAGWESLATQVGWFVSDRGTEGIIGCGYQQKLIHKNSEIETNIKKKNNVDKIVAQFVFLKEIS